jgi:general stress protein 26
MTTGQDAGSSGELTTPGRPASWRVVGVESFEELAEEFARRVARIAWCTAATVGPDGAPRTRVLHPIWEGPVGWIATSRAGLKARHLAYEPRVALTYWDPEQEVASVQATATWVDDLVTRARIWDLFRTTPAPLGYDPASFWPGGWSDPRFALLRLDPTMIEVTTMATMSGPRLRWRTGNRT